MCRHLLPFDIHHRIVDSIKKTNRVIFADEDVVGGASAYMMQQVLEGQNAYRYLDSKPITLCSKITGRRIHLMAIISPR
jgi:pyruvate/2-oxoglutarate/acetoin dehydrogenase E1 component